MYNKTIISYIDSFYERFCAKGSALLAVHFIKFLRRTRSRSSAGDFPKELRQLGELLRMIMPRTSKKRTHRLTTGCLNPEGKNSNSKFTNCARLFSTYTRIKANTAKCKVHQKSRARDYVSRWTSH